MNIIKINIIILLLLSSVDLSGQHRKLQNQPYADQQKFNLGFSIGVHTQDLILSHSGLENHNGEVWFSEIPKYSPGFTVGIIGDINLNRYLNFRITPTLLLGDKHFVFEEQSTGEEFNTSIRNNYFSIPLHLKIAIERINNYKPYVIFGGYGLLEMTSNKNRPVLLKPYDFGLEFGVGCDFYLPLFKIAPEIKFSFGMIDILETDRSDLKEEELQKFARSLSGATQRMITFCLNFE